jgi:NADH:ubiquinone oxidoreductase subunit 2 (subunit N)
MLVAGANDIILLFLGIELASIPTYIMVSISRPLPWRRRPASSTSSSARWPPR